MPNKRRGAGRVVGRAELAEIFGVSVASIDHWVRSGAPCDRDGPTAKFNTAAVIDWRVKQAAVQSSDASPSELDQARRRKTTAEAELAEIDLAVKLGRFVSIEDAAKLVAEEYTAVRSKLLAIPNKLAPQIAIETDRGACHALLAGGINEALNELVGAVGSGDAPGAGDGEGGDAQAATVDHGKPVGGLLSAAFL